MITWLSQGLDRLGAWMRGFRLENVGHPWLWLALLAAGALVLFLTYRGIFQRSERRLTWALLALRGAGLMLLVVMLARPVWIGAEEQVDPGRVAVVVDNSVSMSLPDADGGTRYDRARAAVERLRASLAGRPLAVDLFDV